MGRGNFEGKGQPTAKYGSWGHSAVICAKTAEPMVMPFVLRLGLAQAIIT